MRCPVLPHTAGEAILLRAISHPCYFFRCCTYSWVLGVGIYLGGLEKFQNTNMLRIVKIGRAVLENDQKFIGRQWFLVTNLYQSSIAKIAE